MTRTRDVGRQRRASGTPRFPENEPHPGRPQARRGRIQTSEKIGYSVVIRENWARSHDFEFFARCLHGAVKLGGFAFRDQQTFGGGQGLNDSNTSAS
jgi:hypothetical protein